MTEWTDETRAEVVDSYTGRNPTPENTVELTKELAEEYEKTPNGIRMVLTKAGVYVKKAPSTTSSSGGEKKTSTRVSKADAIAELTTKIESLGGEANEEILSKLTGKAAVYFTEVISTITSND